VCVKWRGFCGRVLEDWQTEVNIPIYKSGYKNECTKAYLSLRLPRNVYAMCLEKKKIEPNLDDKPCSFPLNHRTTDQNLNIQKILEKSRKYAKDVYTLTTKKHTTGFPVKSVRAGVSNIWPVAKTGTLHGCMQPAE